MTKWRILFFTLINVVLLVTGQVVWKMGMNKISKMSFIALFSSPFIWVGAALYAVATVLWLYILKNADLSFAYPLQSMAYVLGIILGHVIFGETISLWTLTGIGLIILGVAAIVAGK